MKNETKEPVLNPVDGGGYEYVKGSPPVKRRGLPKNIKYEIRHVETGETVLKESVCMRGRKLDRFERRLRREHDKDLFVISSNRQQVEADDRARFERECDE